MLLYPGYHVSFYFLYRVIDISFPVGYTAPLPGRTISDIDGIAWLIHMRHIVLYNNFSFFT